MTTLYPSSAPRTLSLLLLALCLTAYLPAQEGIGYEAAFPALDFEFPVEIQAAGDGTDRLFVLEQAGRIKVFDNDSETTAAGTFLDITDIVSFSAGQEIGLLGLAFHPNYSSNGYFYLYHTRQSPISGINVQLVLTRYQVSDDDPNRADPNSRLELFRYDKNQRQSNHNGGKIAFGPDGYLYASIGDGGGGGDPENNAQDLGNVFGSILRIDVDTDGSNPTAPNGNYEIPANNPRVGRSGLDELYAWGIRNTWKFSFDVATGRLWGGDVGQNAREEINLIEGGGNYGWKRFEGNELFSGSTDLTTTPDVKPVYTYGRQNGDRSITMGYVYRGSQSNPAIQDKLIYADYVSGRVWALDYNESTGDATSELLFRTDGEPVSSFGLDESGELYFSAYGSSSQLYRIVDENEPEPGPTEIDGIGEWVSLGNGLDGTVEAIITDGSTVYAAGEFATGNVAVYTTGSGWTSLAEANGRVSALALGEEGQLYAGGAFTSIGGTDAQHIAVWNGSDWQALGEGTDGPVISLVTASSDLFVGGAYTNAGGTAVNNIARWDGTSWSALTDDGTGVAGTNNEVRSLAYDAATNTLYAGGNFASAGNRPANRIASFDGTNWGSLGAGTSGFVQSIAITDESIYAGGNFAIAGGQTVSRIARWDRATESWQSVGEGVSGNVNALAHDGTYLYAGGSFETATTSGGESFLVGNIVRYASGEEWEALGTGKQVGTDNVVNAIALGSDGLFTGGTFTRAGSQSVASTARWIESSGIQDGAVYELESQWNTNIRLAVRNDGSEQSNRVDGLPRDGSVSQQWKFIRVGEDIYELEPQSNPGQRLDVYGARTAPETSIIIWNRHGRANQQWRAIPIGDSGLYRFEPVHAPGKRLDTEPVGGGLRRAFSRTLDGGQSQRWRLIPATGDPAVATTTSTKMNQLAEDFTIFPNPTTERLIIQASGDHTYRFDIYDASGRQVMQGRSAIGNTEVEVGDFAPGLYTLRITTKENGDADGATLRVVVQ